MRTTLLATSLILVCESSVLAQKAGDRIVVIAATAQLKSRNDVVGSVPKGSILKVKEVNGDWFWVIYSGASSTTQGWIKRPEVISIEKALDFFNDEMQRNSTAELYAIRGAIWKEKHEYDKAIADFDEAVRRDPQQSTTLRRRGNVWAAKADYDKAIVDYSKAIRLDPKDARCYSNRGRAWGHKKEQDKAIADFTEAIRIDPLSASDFYGRGDAWSRKGTYDKAIDDYTETIRLDPKQALAYSRRGYAWNTKAGRRNNLYKF